MVNTPLTTAKAQAIEGAQTNIPIRFSSKSRKGLIHASLPLSVRGLDR